MNIQKSGSIKLLVSVARKTVQSMWRLQHRELYRLLPNPNALVTIVKSMR